MEGGCTARQESSGCRTEPGESSGSSPLHKGSKRLPSAGCPGKDVMGWLSAWRTRFQSHWGPHSSPLRPQPSFAAHYNCRPCSRIHSMYVFPEVSWAAGLGLPEEAKNKSQSPQG